MSFPCPRTGARVTTVSTATAARRTIRFIIRLLRLPGSHDLPPLAVAFLDVRIRAGEAGRLHAGGVPLDPPAGPQRQHAQERDLGQAGAVLEVATRGRAALAGVEPIAVV